MGRLAEMQRKLLEQIMGPEAMGIVPQDLKLTDPKVCRNFLCGTCPHELFTNTKMDLGQCPKMHSGRLKEEYEAAKKENPGDREMSTLEQEYEQNIMQFVAECDRRIMMAQKKLEKTPEENNKTTALMREIGEIQSAYDLASAEVEQLGEAGKVEEAMAESAKAEALKAEKQEKERELQQLTDTSGASGHQKLRVCDICGAYLSVLDSDRRLADHFGGKMHLGYLTLRQTIEAWRNRPRPSASASNATPVGNKSFGPGGGGPSGPINGGGFGGGAPNGSDAREGGVRRTYDDASGPGGGGRRGHDEERRGGGGGGRYGDDGRGMRRHEEDRDNRDRDRDKRRRLD